MSDRNIWIWKRVSLTTMCWSGFISLKSFTYKTLADFDRCTVKSLKIHCGSDKHLTNKILIQNVQDIGSGNWSENKYLYSWMVVGNSKVQKGN